MLELFAPLKYLLIALSVITSVIAPPESNIPIEGNTPGGAVGNNAIYRIDEIAREKTGPLVLVRVSFWTTRGDYNSGKLPEFKNDFRMLLFATSSQFIQDAEGKIKTESGAWTLLEELTDEDPPVLETVENDINADIQNNILAYLKRYQARKNTNKPLSIDGTDNRIKVNPLDFSGIMSKTEVKNLKNQTFEISQ